MEERGQGESKHMSNEMIVHVFGEIRDSLERIENQTTKTNGRVTGLENWQSFIKGGLAVVVILLIPILFLLIKGIVASGN